MGRIFPSPYILALTFLFNAPVLAQDSNSGIDREKCVGPAYQAAEVSRRAKIVSIPEPLFSEEARANYVSGRVVVNGVLCRTGQVTDIQVVRSLPYGMTGNALQAARRIKFVPAAKDGENVSQYFQIEYGFNESYGYAQEPPSGRMIESVDVIGIRRLGSEDILRHIKTRPGQVYRQEQITGDLQAIVGLGHFDKAATRVTVEDGARGGVVVIFEVIELPIIREVRFEGLQSVQEPEVSEAFREHHITVIEGAIYDPVKVREAVGLLKGMLVARGQARSEVTVRVEVDTATSVVIIFVADEKR